MAQSKKKIQDLGKKQKIATKSNTPKQDLSEQLEQVDFWKAEIEELQNQKFSNLDDAIKAVIERALNNFTFEAVEKDNARQFIFEMISTDPEIIDILKETLDIKESN